MLRVGVTVRIAAVALLIFSSGVLLSWAVDADDQICDVEADYALGSEDYVTAIVLHRRLLRSHPDSALAHYHLGFAYGIVGRVGEEINEYRAAVRLGLNKWDLFLNLGLAYLDQRELAKATAALEDAVLFGPGHAEAHYNLAIVYERENRLKEALSEIVAARHLAPGDLDTGNANAIICAEMGDFPCARDIWTHLVQTAPNYAPARINLTMLSRSPAVTGMFQHPAHLSDSRVEVAASHTAGKPGSRIVIKDCAGRTAHRTRGDPPNHYLN